MIDLSLPVTEIMTREAAFVSPSQKLIDVKHIFEKKNFHHHIPVVENGKLKGIISLVDFLYAIKGASLDDSDETFLRLKVEDIMRLNPVTCPSGCSIEEVAQELAKGEVHAIIIADESRLKGIVSTADVIRFFLEKA